MNPSSLHSQAWKEFVPWAQSEIDQIYTTIAGQYGGRVYGGLKNEECAIQKVLLRGANIEGLDGLARNTIAVHAYQIDVVNAELRILSGGNSLYS